jgi:hypothetical protein
MAKYRKKPIVVDVFQWLMDDVPEWITSAIRANKINFDIRMIISTPDGEMLASPGDYIIKGVNGELYPCKPDIFEQTYELIKEGD